MKQQPQFPGIDFFTDELYAALIDEAECSERKRKNYNFHASMDENPHRFLNVLVRGTYIAPHRHLFPPKSETFLILDGEILFFLFDDDGKIVLAERLGSSPGLRHGIDIAPGLWHTLVVMSDHAVCFEVKPGPYTPADDKEFAPWAPREHVEGWERYLNGLERHGNGGDDLV